MAIKKMEFAKGDELNIRSFPRIEAKYILDNLDDLMQNASMMIVKCGKSFWDVSQNPEIFQQAEEFNPQELTGIEKKEMQQAAASPLARAYEEPKTDNDPMSMLYQKTEEDESEVELEYLSRKTFYVTPLVNAVIDTYCFRNRSDVSEAIRELILRGAPEDIMQEAKKIAEADHKMLAKTYKAQAKGKGKGKKKRIIL